MLLSIARTALLFAACLSAPSFAAAQCSLPMGAQSEASAIGAVIELSQKILGPVEVVSKDTADYLKEEIKISVQQQNSARFITVTEHSSYRAWNVRNDLAEAKGWLEASLQPLQLNNSAPSRKIAAWSVLKALNAFNDLMLSIDLYVAFDRRRSRPLLKPSDPALMLTTAYESQQRLISILACML